MTFGFLGLGLGFSRRSGGVPLAVVSQDFLVTSLPVGWTYTRSDTVATFRNSSGELTTATSNGARFNHTSTGTALGLLLEGSRINRCTNHNATPAVTTNVSVTGTATVTLVTDATPLATAKIGNVVTGNVFQIAGGASGGTAIIAGGTGATGACSASVWARDVTSTGASFGITPAPTATAISGSAYARYVSNNLTATNAADTMVITVPAGVTINFILNQLETAIFASSEIRTAGATATRQNCRISDTSINTRGYGFGMAAGAIIGEFDTYDIGNHGAMFVYYSDNNDGTSGDINSVGHRMVSNRAKTDAQYNWYGPTPTSPYGGTTDQLSIDKSGQGALARLRVGTSWTQGGDTYLYANPLFKRGSLGTFSRTPDRLYIGSSVFTQQLFGHLRKLWFFNKGLSLTEAGQYLLDGTERVSICSGQSNMDGWFSNSTGSTNGGEQVAVTTMDSFWPTTRNYCINGSTSGTRVSGPTPASCWLSEDLSTVGVPFQRWLDLATILNAQGIIPEVIFDTSGESDAGNNTKAGYKDAQIEKFTRMNAAFGITDENNFIPVMLINLGRESSSNLAGYQVIAEAGIELARDYPWIHYVERIDIAKDGTIHINDAGCRVLARRTVRKAMKVLGETVTGPVDGPQITAVSRSGATVTVTIAYDPDGGTDFTPSSSIAGFHFFDNNVDTSGEIAITAAVRTNATTITLTLASTPSNVNQLLYYGWRSLQAEDATIANLVKDNSAETLPVRRAVFTSSNTGASFTSAF